MGVGAFAGWGFGGSILDLGVSGWGFLGVQWHEWVFQVEWLVETSTEQT